MLAWLGFGTRFVGMIKYLFSNESNFVSMTRILLNKITLHNLIRQIDAQNNQIVSKKNSTFLPNKITMELFKRTMSTVSPVVSTSSSTPCNFGPHIKMGKTIEILYFLCC